MWLRIVSYPNFLEEGGNLATKSLAKLQKNFWKTFAFCFVIKAYFVTFFERYVWDCTFLEGKLKDFRAFQCSFGLLIFSFNFYLQDCLFFCFINFSFLISVHDIYNAQKIKFSIKDFFRKCDSAVFTFFRCLTGL